MATRRDPISGSQVDKAHPHTRATLGEPTFHTFSYKTVANRLQTKSWPGWKGDPLTGPTFFHINTLTHSAGRPTLSRRGAVGSGKGVNVSVRQRLVDSLWRTRKSSQLFIMSCPAFKLQSLGSGYFTLTRLIKPFVMICFSFGKG